jgi:hypothetical protein
MPIFGDEDACSKPTELPPPMELPLNWFIKLWLPLMLMLMACAAFPPKPVPDADLKRELVSTKDSPAM